MNRKSWRIVYFDHQQIKMWGYFTMPFMKQNMNLFNTITEVEEEDAPEYVVLDHPYVANDLVRPNSEQFKQMLSEFVSKNIELAETYLYRPYTEKDKVLRKFVDKARKFVGYPTTFPQVDILRNLTYIYESLKSK